MSSLLAAVERDPARKWRDCDIRRLDLDPARVRRWFKRHHGMTFHVYQRARRLGRAFEQIREGRHVTSTAFEHGYESLSGFRDAFEKLFGSTPSRCSGTIINADRIATPVGPMLACATEEHLCLLEFADRPMLETQLKRLRRYVGGNLIPGPNRILERTRTQLDEYFEGQRVRFDLPLLLEGSSFQKLVWEALLTIPYGRTSTYSELARSIGRPRAVRAAGTANGDNRLAIVIPCHRIIRTDGSLGGYGGGRWRKRFLLTLERG